MRRIPVLVAATAYVAAVLFFAATAADIFQLVATRLTP